MSNKKAYDQKHLTTTQRIKIEKGLMDGMSFASIARDIEKHPSTIEKEVKKNRFFSSRDNPDKKLQCAHFKSCQMRFLCDDKDCVKMCKRCYDVEHQISKCTILCPEYKNLSANRFRKLHTSATDVLG